MHGPDGRSTPKGDEIKDEHSERDKRPEEFVIFGESKPSRHSQSEEHTGNQDLVIASAQSERRKRERRSKEEQHRPDNADDTPRRLIFNDAVGNESADAVNRQVTQRDILQFLAKQAGDQTDGDRQLVTTNQA